MSRASRRPSPRPWGCLTLVAAAGVLALAAELAARRVGPELPAWRGLDDATVVLTGHPDRLWGLAPGVRRNGETTATINDLGLRGPPPRDPPPAHRALVLGDSTFFGHGVADDEALGAVLERGLDGVEVLNAAVPGYSTEQVALLMDDVGWGLRPDLLLVGAFWSDTSWEAFADRDLLRSRRFARYNPLARSAAFRWAVGALSPWLGDRRVVTWRSGEALPARGVRRVPVADYAANLDALAARAAEADAAVVLLSPAGRADLAPPPPGGPPWASYRLAQRAVADRWGLPLVELRPLLVGDEPVTRALADTLLLDDLHPTAEGHRRIGEGLAAALRALDWPATPLRPVSTGPLDLTAALAAEAPWTTRAEAPRSDTPSSLLLAP